VVIVICFFPSKRNSSHSIQQCVDALDAAFLRDHSEATEFLLSSQHRQWRSANSLSAMLVT